MQLEVICIYCYKEKVKTKSKILKAIVIIGGQGSRVPELTAGVSPKAFIRFSKALPKSICAYQLESLKRAGVTHVLLVINQEWQGPIIQHSIRSGEFPDMNYSIILSKKEHPFMLFRRDEVLTFIKNTDIIFSYGDIAYSSQTVQDLVRLGNKNSTSSGCIMHSTSSRWEKDGKFLNFNKDDSDLVVSSRYELTRGFTVHVPFFLRAEEFVYLKNEGLRKSPRTIHFLQRLVKDRKFSVLRPKVLDKITTLEDARRVERLLLRLIKPI